MKRSRQPQGEGSAQVGQAGPASLGAVLETHLRNIQHLNFHLRQCGLDVERHWKTLFERGVVITSAYSGLGQSPLGFWNIKRRSG